MKSSWFSRLIIILGLTLGLTSCVETTGNTGDKGYVNGDGAIKTIPVAERSIITNSTGTDLAGKSLRLYSPGKVTVLNVWASWCGPCRAETPRLVAVAKNSKAIFRGINVRDLASTAQAFERANRVPYRSLFDPTGKLLLNFGGTVSPNAIPSTLILDAKGRVAVRILGEVPGVVTFRDLIAEVAK